MEIKPDNVDAWKRLVTEREWRYADVYCLKWIVKEQEKDSTAYQATEECMVILKLRQCFFFIKHKEIRKLKLLPRIFIFIFQSATA